MSYSATIQHCPQCSGAVPREHFAEVDVPATDTSFARTDTYLYCAFCGRGLETSQYQDGHVFRLDYCERTEPQQFGYFLKRLEDASAA